MCHEVWIDDIQIVTHVCEFTCWWWLHVLLYLHWIEIMEESGICLRKKLGTILNEWRHLCFFLLSVQSQENMCLIQGIANRCHFAVPWILKYISASESKNAAKSLMMKIIGVNQILFRIHFLRSYFLLLIIWLTTSCFFLCSLHNTAHPERHDDKHVYM